MPYAAGLHFIPLLMVCYVVAYLDRINIGIAKLNMLTDLQFSEAAYGLGAGLFLIGYMLFEVPSNLIMRGIEVRVWMRSHHGVMRIAFRAHGHRSLSVIHIVFFLGRGRVLSWRHPLSDVPVSQSSSGKDYRLLPDGHPAC